MKPLGRSAARWVVEVLPALLVAGVLAPWIIAKGQAWPWRPSMVDLDVYRLTAQAVLTGRDIYAVRTPVWELPFIYPPIAALLLTPTALLPVTVVRVGWLLLNVLALLLVLHRAGVRRGWVTGVVAALLVAVFEPIRTTLGYGQVNLLLMACVVADVLPGDDLDGVDLEGRGRRRRLPRGLLLGLAAAIKLTPLLFVAYALLTRRWRVVAVATLSFVALTGIGYVVLPSASTEFVGKVLHNDLYGDPNYIGNQSLVGALGRVGALDRLVAPLGLTARAVGLVAGAVAALGGLLAAARLAERSAEVLAVGIVGVATCLASPISWTHHYVWAVLLFVGALVPSGARVPLWLRGFAAAWAAWIALCPPLALGRAEPAMFPPGTRSHIVLGLLGPAFGAALVVATLAWLLVPDRIVGGRPRPRHAR